MVALGHFVPGPMPTAPQTEEAQRDASQSPLQPPVWANEPRGSKGRPPKYPFASLPVNGTFRLPPGDGQPTLRRMQEYCSQRGRALNKRFLCHRYADGTIEVWRKA